MLLNNGIDRVVILRALQLGDLLCAVPAVRGLRRMLPRAHIALIGLPWAAELVDRYPTYLDELIEFPGYAGIPERPAELEEVEPFFEEMAGRRWDLAVQLQGDGTITNAFIARLGARSTAGFCTADAPGPDPENFLDYPDGVPEPHRHLALLAHLGAPRSVLADDRLEFPVRDDDRRRAAALLGAHWARPYAIVHPGARDERRRWPIEGFAAVAEHLVESGLLPVLTGSSDEAPVVDQLQATLKAPVLALPGATDLGAMAALLEDARLVVANDTGVSHLAAAVGTPSVIVFRASDPRRWAPTDRERHVALVPHGAPACWWDTSCPHEGHHRAAVVSAERVVAAVDRQLSRWSRRGAGTARRARDRDGWSRSDPGARRRTAGSRSPRPGP